MDWSIKQGAKITEMRVKKGFTQDYIAQKLDVKAASVSGWERAACRPTRKHLHDMAFLYNVPVEEILTGVTDNNDMTGVTAKFKPVPIDFTKPFSIGGTTEAGSGTKPIVEFRADGMVFGTKFDKKTQDLLGMMATLTGKTENEMLDIAVREYAQYIFDWNKALEGFCNEKS